MRTYNVSGGSSIYTGLFKTNYGIIKNVVIKSANIKVSPNNYGSSVTEYVGIIAGNNSGIIRSCIITDSSIVAHSTDIELKWKASYGEPPSVLSGSTWERYATLKFTGKTVDQWSNGNMTLMCGSVVGKNSGTISDCLVNSTNIETKLITFSYNEGAKLKLCVGGIAGSSTGSVEKNTCSKTVSINASADIHHISGGWAAIFPWNSQYLYPSAECHYGIVVGEGLQSCSDNKSFVKFTCTTCVFAPTYQFDGNEYNLYNMAKEDNIIWISHYC